MRINRLTGGIAVLREGPALVLPLRARAAALPAARPGLPADRPAPAPKGAAPFQTVEGLSVGVAVAVRYALDRDRVAEIAEAAARERRARI